MNQTQSIKLLYTKEMDPLFTALKGSIKDLEGLQVPELNEMLQHTSKPFCDAENSCGTMSRPILILHSSGSTGKLFLS